MLEKLNAGLLIKILKTPGVIPALVTTLLIILAFVAAIFTNMFPFGVSEISFSDNTLIMKANVKGRPSSILRLHASTLWLDTGIDVKPGESVLIEAQGVVHTVVHKINTAAILDIKPKNFWHDISVNKAVPNKTDERESPYRICRDQPVGKLVAALTGVSLDENNPFPKTDDEVYFVNKQALVANTKSVVKHLYLAVNDNILESRQCGLKRYAVDDKTYTKKLLSYPFDIYDSCKVDDVDYILDSSCLRQKERGGQNDNCAGKTSAFNDLPKYQECVWGKLAKSSYHRLWYDDNAGTYTVVISEPQDTDKMMRRYQLPILQCRQGLRCTSVNKEDQINEN